MKVSNYYIPLYQAGTDDIDFIEDSLINGIEIEMDAAQADVDYTNKVNNESEDTTMEMEKFIDALMDEPEKKVLMMKSHQLHLTL